MHSSSSSSLSLSLFKFSSSASEISGTDLLSALWPLDDAADADPCSGDALLELGRWETKVEDEEEAGTGGRGEEAGGEGEEAGGARGAVVGGPTERGERARAPERGLGLNPLPTEVESGYGCCACAGLPASQPPTEPRGDTAGLIVGDMRGETGAGLWPGRGEICGELASLPSEPAEELGADDPSRMRR